MKKLSVSLALVAGAMMLTSCGTTGGSIAQGVGSAILNGSNTNSSASTATSTASTLGGLLSNILGASTKLSESSIVGTWNYTGADCVFESENLLAKAGGAVAASKIESEINSSLSKVGIKQGSCSFTFNSDKTYTANLGGRTISGTYSLDATNKKIKMTYLAGLASMTPRVSMQGGKLCLLMESSKLLTLMKGVSALSKSSTAGAISSILGNYNGMYVGMQLSK